MAMTADELREARLRDLKNREKIYFALIRKTCQDLAGNYVDHAKEVDITHADGQMVRERAVMYMTLAGQSLKAADLVKKYADEAQAAGVGPAWAFNLNARRHTTVHILG